MEIKRAIALRYRSHADEAPRVTAKGAGVVAEALIRAAEAGKVPIREDADLTAALMALEVEEVIPPELFEVVAQVLAYVYQSRT
ncbi:flagellar biosynthesis protein FlhB [Alicyclobacillaceae bacterium I2511]|nr:flagellar biosynthesis protein FlhB [Alicyclobacillaceae bacterium I2511]